MTNTKNKREIINVGEELVNYLDANTSVIEDLVKQMIHQNNETKNCLLKIENILKNYSEEKKSFEKIENEIKKLNNNLSVLLSNKDSSIHEEEKCNFITKLDSLIKNFENNISLNNKLPSLSEDITNLILNQILQLQQQQQQMINFQQHNLTTNIREIIDSSILKLLLQFNYDGQCNCLLKNKIFLSLSDNLQLKNGKILSKTVENENNGYSFSDILFYEILCFILGIVIYLIAIDFLNGS
ncbi:Hypothetical protein SRAE_2000457400 [Strongyloides ratti]|uniref:Uncharacterized protein n=1 Tax=Strongyloides ratti TaxID=34506 RepID=A0A090LJN4_STRRB|nr:Hypothetical protein SRAE_2000457400 [Strongyloides ratti]CEF69928.1 Hypothetical protein SRAE_2000457400 [Strongyloides ratti]